MQYQQVIMGMPIAIELEEPDQEVADRAFAIFRRIDSQFSPYKVDSEVSKISRGDISASDATAEMQEVIAACDRWHQRTRGYFNAHYNNGFDPSGYVKGWAIRQVADFILAAGRSSFYINAGGDALAVGRVWRAGIRLPDNAQQYACRLGLNNMAIATSGAYIRGAHIINPFTGNAPRGPQSISVIGPDIITADVLATTFFAMGDEYTSNLGRLLPADYLLYVIEADGRATYSPALQQFMI